MPDLSQMPGLISSGDARGAAALAAEALAAGVDPEDLVNTYMIPTMDEVGRAFECGEAFVPELLVAGNAMKAALAVLEPHLRASGVQPLARVVIGTVKGDIHDIGKNLVASMLVGGGFEVHDIGVNVRPEAFIEAIGATNPAILALSTLLTTTMPAMRQTIQALDDAGLRDQVKVLVGGAPVTQAFADQIGADGYSPTAAGAVEVARRLIAA